MAKALPRRRKRTLSKQAAQFVAKKIRRLAHEGVKAPRRVAAALSMARRRGFKVPKRGRRNPRGVSERKSWEQVKYWGRQLTRNIPKASAIGMALENLALTMLAQLRSGVHENPSLAVVGALNPAVQCLGYVTGPLKYRRTGGQWPGWYQHRFKGRHAKLYAMPDGSLKIAAS